MTQLDVVETTRKMGFDAIEFAGLSVPSGESTESFAERVKDACAEANLPIACYAIGANFLAEGADMWQAEAERLRSEVKIANTLGVSAMRHDATGGFPSNYTGPRGFDDALPSLAKGCRAVTEFAADLGIRTMVENHGFFCQDSDRIEKLVNAVNHANFGTLVDIGNFLCADEDPAKAVARVAPYVSHAHAKDFHVKPGSAPNPGSGWFQSRAGNYLRGAIIGHGDVPVAQCIGILQRTGYDGVLSIEFEGMEDPLSAIPIGLENLRRSLQEH
jgi:sugar phosphate isomerase/epimerase